jgi:DNA-directed RNA polymerase subunit M/transcription elongation factor TFIIS
MSLPKLNTPTFELTLPSTGKKIKYRPFLVKEHKILLTMAEADDAEIARVVSELVDVCTFNKLNVKSLPHFDIEYIFLQLRAKSISESVEVIVNCECGNKIDTTFNIDNLKVEKNPKHTNKIMLTKEYGIEMNYPVFEEVVNVFASNDTSKVIDLIVRSIKGVFDNENYWDAKEQTKEEIEEFIFSLTKDQFDLIENFFVTAPKIVQEIETDCPKCGRHNVSRLEGLSNFFV